MATKSALTTAINGFITAIITQTKVRNAYLELINVLFQTTVTQSLLTSSDVFGHVLKFKKQGNIVHVSGYIVNKYAVSKSNQNIVAISDSLFYAKTSEPTVVFGFTEATGTPVQLLFTGSDIFLTTNLYESQKIWINANYQTND